jgi:RND family efflux transporter MFP subunit
MTFALNSVRRCSLLAVIATAGMFLVPPSFAGDNSVIIVSGQTKPSQEVRLAFAAPGIVTDVPVKEGDRVKAGQLLAKQDDRQDRAELEKMKLDAAATYDIDYSKLDKKVKEVQLKRKQQMMAQHVASASEVEEAQLAVDLDDARINQAQLDHDKKGFDAKKQEVRVEQMQLLSPVDGVVQTLNIHPGEMADPQNRDGVMVVVRNDPLWVEVHLPTSQSQQLHLGETMQVQYAGDKDWQTGKINFIRPQADAASDTQEVRVEVPNPTGRDSGLQMQVKLPDSITAVASGPTN